MTKLDLQWQSVSERSRTYYYSFGDKVTLENVAQVAYAPNGNVHHYAKGKIEIVRGGWVRISIDEYVGGATLEGEAVETFF